MDIFIVFIISFALLILLTLLLAYICYRMAFRADRNPPDPYKLLDKEKYAPYKEYSEGLIRALAERRYERVEITSHDGKRLVGKLYRGDDGAPIDIMFHGYRSQPGWDFSGGAEECIALGHTVLLPDQRSHGESEGHAICFGVMERFDVHAWCEYTERCFNSDIYLWGISMGAASVLMSLEFPFSERVRGVIADCPYSSPQKIIALVGQRMHLPAACLMPFCRLGALVFGGFRLGKSSACESIRKSKIPVLLVHGDADNFVPYEMSAEIYKSAVNAGVQIDFYTFVGASHGMSYLSDPIRYREAIIAFVEKSARGAGVHE